MAFNVNSLPAYVEENKIDLKVKTVLSPKTADLVTLQTGLKGKTAINLLSNDVIFQDGTTCGFDAAGNTTISQRFIEPAHIKVNMEWCDKDLLNKYAQYEVVSAATGKTLPFEEKIVSDVIAKVAAKVESGVWDGDSTVGLDGFTMIIAKEKAGEHPLPYNIVNATSSVYDDIISLYNILPADVTMQEDFAIFTTADLFKAFVQELVAKNMYHYNANDAAGEVTIPGTACKVIAVPNWKNANDISAIGARKSNLFYGLDLEGDSTDFDLWYSKDDRTFKLAIEFVIGSGIAYPEEVSYLYNA